MHHKLCKSIIYLYIRLKNSGTHIKYINNCIHNIRII